MPKTAVFTCVSFFLGLALGWMLGQREPGGAPPSVAVPEGPVTVLTPPSPPEGAAEPAPAPAKQEADSPALPVGADGAERLLSRALLAIPAPAGEKGTGRVEGLVRTENGEPVAGVVVRGFRARDDRRGRGRNPGKAAPDTIEARVVEMVTSERWRDVNERRAETDAGGRFVLTDLSDSAYHLEASREGYEIRTDGGHEDSWVRPGERLDFVASPVIDLSIIVLLPDGSTPENASIFWSKDLGRSRSTNSRSWSSEDPKLRLKTGTFRLYAASGKDEELRSEEQEVTLAAGTEPAALTFQLRASPGVRGRLVLPEGEIVNSLRVYALRYTGAEPPSVEVLRRSGNSQWLHRDSGGFRYSFKNLVAGAYLLGAARGEGNVTATMTVEVADQVVEADLVVPPLNPADFITVRVFGPSGEALTDLSFSAGYRSRRSNSSGGASEVRQKDGSYWIPYYRSDSDSGSGDDTDRRYYVQITSQAYGTKEIEYRRDGDREFEVRFGDPATLEVQVDGHAGSGYEGRLEVGVIQAGTGGNRMHRSEHSSRDALDPDGRKVLGPLEPGNYEAVLSVKLDQFSTVPVASVPVNLRAGKNRTTLRLPALYTLTVQVDPGAPDANLQLRPAGREDLWWGNPREVGKDGRVTFESLPAGSYVLTLWGGGEPGMMTVNVPAPAVVRFEPQPINALQVKVDDEAGYLATAGFRTGDLVVGVNGSEFENLIQMQTTMLTLMKEKEATLLIHRGDTKLELKIEPIKLQGREDLGGNFEPASR